MVIPSYLLIRAGSGCSDRCDWPGRCDSNTPTRWGSGVLAHVGLSSRVSVFTGHSKLLLPRLRRISNWTSGSG